MKTNHLDSDKSDLVSVYAIFNVNNQKVYPLEIQLSKFENSILGLIVSVHEG